MGDLYTDTTETGSSLDSTSELESGLISYSFDINTSNDIDIETAFSDSSLTFDEINQRLRIHKTIITRNDINNKYQKRKSFQSGINYDSPNNIVSIPSVTSNNNNNSNNNNSHSKKYYHQKRYIKRSKSKNSSSHNHDSNEYKVYLYLVFFKSIFYINVY